ncbi:MAG TPA: hypothetical protein VK824_06090 [Planctomycetota bacterium]|nr:hypothetical protein [Planctomycetota bacterium]
MSASGEVSSAMTGAPDDDMRGVDAGPAGISRDAGAARDVIMAGPDVCDAPPPVRAAGAGVTMIRGRSALSPAAIRSNNTRRPAPSPVTAPRPAMWMCVFIRGATGDLLTRVPRRAQRATCEEEPSPGSQQARSLAIQAIRDLLHFFGAQILAGE